MTATPEPDLPESLARRPVDPRRNLPIPFMNMRPADVTDIDGEPDTADFTAIWGPSVLKCAHERLCGICGEPLGYWMAFLGGPKSAANRSYMDPPFHEGCATAALSLCPHIAVPHHKRAPDHRLTEGAAAPVGFDASRTDEWVMGITRDFQLARLGEGLVFRAAPFKRVRRFVYVDGVLTETAGAGQGGAR